MKSTQTASILLALVVSLCASEASASALRQIQPDYSVSIGTQRFGIVDVGALVGSGVGWVAAAEQPVPKTTSKNKKDCGMSFMVGSLQGFVVRRSSLK